MIGVWITDLHLKESNTEHFNSIVDQAIAACQKHNCKYIFNGGDSFHSRLGQPQDVMVTFLNALNRIQGAGLQMVCVVGNHDKTNYSSDNSFLMPFSNHPALNLISPDNDQLVVNGVTLRFINYYTEDVYNSLLKSMKGGDILMTHIGVSGALMNSGMQLSSNVLLDGFSKFKTVLIGHYHNAQIMGNIVYTGSTIPHNFGEDNIKSMFLIKDDCSLEKLPTKIPTYHTIDAKDPEEVYKLVGKYDFLRARFQKDIPLTDKVMLKQKGVKIIIEKPQLIISKGKEVQIFTTKMLMNTYEEWATKRGLVDKEVGVKLLETVI